MQSNMAVEGNHAEQLTLSSKGNQDKLQDESIHLLEKTKATNAKSESGSSEKDNEQCPLNENAVVKDVSQSSDPNVAKHADKHVETPSDVTRGKVAQMVDRLDKTPVSVNSTAVKELFAANNSMKTIDTTPSMCGGNHDRLAQILEGLGKTTKKLNENVAKLQNEIGSLREEKTQQEKKVCDLEAIQFKEKTKLGIALQQIAEHEERFRAVLGIMVRQDEEISNLKRILGQMYTKSVKNNLLISGLDKKRAENPAWMALEFFKVNLKITRAIPIIRAYRVGQGSPRVIVVELENPDDKVAIFQKVSLLKGQKNGTGKPYFVSEQLADDVMEAKRQNNYVKQQNNKLPTAQQRDVTFKKGALYIDNRKYVSQLQAPTVRQLVDPTIKEKDVQKQVDIIEGDSKDHGDSVFVAYAARVHTLEHVHGAYRKVRSVHPQATHVMCAFRFPGNDPGHTFGMCDDGEHGGARRILGALNETHTYNCAVYVVRYYGGSHIGPERFSIIEELAKSAITESEPALRDRRNDWSHLPAPSEDRWELQDGTTSQEEEEFGSVPSLPNEGCAALDSQPEGMDSQ